ERTIRTVGSDPAFHPERATESPWLAAVSNGVGGERGLIIRRKPRELLSLDVVVEKRQRVRVEPAAGIVVRPLSKNIVHECAGRTVLLSLPHPEKLSVDFGYGRRPLYLFLSPPETDIPTPTSGNASVVTFPSGQITEMPLLT